MDMRFLKCEKCGKVIGIVHDSPCPTMCCGQAMVDIKAGTTEASVEKHIPVITTRNNNLVDVTVGAALHPMEEDHFIEWIALKTEQGMHIKKLHPGDAPKASFSVVDGNHVYLAYAYCNKHGLWSTN